MPALQRDHSQVLPLRPEPRRDHVSSPPDPRATSCAGRARCVSACLHAQPDVLRRDSLAPVPSCVRFSFPPLRSLACRGPYRCAFTLLHAHGPLPEKATLYRQSAQETYRYEASCTRCLWACVPFAVSVSMSMPLSVCACVSGSWPVGLSLSLSRARSLCVSSVSLCRISMPASVRLCHLPVCTRVECLSLPNLGMSSLCQSLRACVRVCVLSHVRSLWLWPCLLYLFLSLCVCVCARACACRRRMS